MERRVNQVFELSTGSLRRLPRAGVLLALMGVPVLAVAATLELAERTSVARPAPVRQGPMPVLMLAPQPQRKSAPEPPQIATLYLSWLREDVAYIIRDQERQAFNRLTTDAERDQFIEQFWLVRDPTPGTFANEFKDEHYRRIAYTNEHYGYNAKNLPGWKTDRGRIYITYGPADEIEDHTYGGEYKRPPEEGGGMAEVFPFQKWRYRYIEGVGTNVIIEFIDPTLSGEFRMTTDPAEKIKK